MLIVPRQGVEVPRLGLGQIMALNKDPGLLPRIRGWVQGTTRLIPDCPRCEASVASGDELAVRFDEPTQDYVCDACGLDEGIAKGPIVKQVAQKNLVTRDFMPGLFFNNESITPMLIFISNDDTGVHEFKTIAESTMNGTVVSGAITAVKNLAAEYYTYTHTFTAPGSARIIRQIGLSLGGTFQAILTNWKSIVASSVTELSSEISQGTGETFEVVYKYQMSEVTP